MNGNNGYPNPMEMQNQNGTCPRCGAPTEVGAVFCGSCGLNLKTVMKKKCDILSVLDYIVMMIAFSIPVMNIVLMLYWSFGANVGVNRKNFSRAYLAITVISVVCSILMVTVFGSTIGYVMDAFLYGTSI